MVEQRPRKLHEGHGRTNTPEYKIYKGIKKRCYNPNAIAYERYGGRGIVMCDEWRESFVAFLSHIGPRPSKKHSVDRIDPNGHYEPGNVRWATAKQQANNKASAGELLELNGKSQTIKTWADEIGLHVNSLRKRLDTGKSLDFALTAPPAPIQISIAWRGKSQSIAEWAKETGINVSTLCNRLWRGWTIDRALSSPTRGVSHAP